MKCIRYLTILRVLLTTIFVLVVIRFFKLNDRILEKEELDSYHFEARRLDTLRPYSSPDIETGDVSKGEFFCGQRASTISKVKSSQTLDKQFLTWHWTWISQRIHNLWIQWLVARGSLDSMPFMCNRTKKRILILPGVLTETPFAKANCIRRGCPLGDLVQWADLIAASHILGHKVTVMADLQMANTRLKNTATSIKTLPCDSNDNFDVIFADYLALSRLDPAVKKLIKCRLRVVDAYGTEPAFNNRQYALEKHLASPYGKLDLNPKQYFTFFPHTPDNTFLGFAVPSFENGGSKKENISLLYGKDVGYFRDKDNLIHDVGSVLKVHATLPLFQAPHAIKNHGLMTGLEYRKLMEKTKVLLGVGVPVESSGALEAIARGVVFLQPTKSEIKSDEVMKGKPTTRKLSSQVPYLEKFVGPPYVYTIDENDREQINSTLKDILTTDIEPFLPREFSMEGMMERLAILFEKQDFCDPGAEIWPPLSEMKVYSSAVGHDCIDTCHLKGLVCEPVYFPKITDSYFQRSGITCKEKVTRRDIFYPAVLPDTGHCIAQSNPSLYSCAGRKAGLIRICPCREYIKYQVALCKTCLKPTIRNL